MKKKMFSLLTVLATNSVMVGSVLAFKDPGIKPNGTALGTLTGNVTTILGVVQWIGFIVGIAMAIWIGIKYLTAGAGEKAKVKDTMIPWLIGAGLVALAPTLASQIFQMFSGSSTATE